MCRLRTEASFKPLATLQISDSPQTKAILFQNVRSLHLRVQDVWANYNIEKLMLTFLLKQNFACQIEMTHMS